MEKISGLVLDMFDDPAGAVMRKVFPTKSSVPELLKTATALTPAQRDALPDDAYALVIEQGGTRLRKYACVDAGTTATNITYFMMNYDKLPEVAVKTAASNLCTACTWYDIEPPDELKKLSSGNIPTIGKQRIWKDLDGQTYGSDGTSWDLQKTAEVVGTADMPTTFGKDNLTSKTRKTPLSVAKTAMKGPVDVTGLEAPKVAEARSTRYFALPHARTFPLDSYAQVKTASGYFEEHYRGLSPEDRHTFAVNLSRRAEPLGIKLGSSAAQYSGTSLGDAAFFVDCVSQRMRLCEVPSGGSGDKLAGGNALELYRDLLRNSGELTAPLLARTLAEVDKVAAIDRHWDHAVVDPFLAVYGRGNA